MSKQAIEYLQKYKNQFSSEKLVVALQKAGYDQADIQTSIEKVYGLGGSRVGSKLSAQEEHKFWDFSVTWNVYSKKEKIKDFIFGLILPWVTLWLLFAFDDDVAWISIFFYFAYLKFFYKKRKYIFRGVVAAVGLTAIVFVVGFVILMMAFGW